MQGKRFNTVEIVAIKLIKRLNLSRLDYIAIAVRFFMHQLYRVGYAKMLDFCNFHSVSSTIGLQRLYSLVIDVDSIHNIWGYPSVRFNNRSIPVSISNGSDRNFQVY